MKLGETTAQDLTIGLGPPLRVHHKEDRRMSIHANEQVNNDPGCKTFYSFCIPSFQDHEDFYNYFQHGIDFLISGVDHVVRKIVLHTNIVIAPVSHVSSTDIDFSLARPCFNDTRGATGR